MTDSTCRGRLRHQRQPDADDHRACSRALLNASESRPIPLVSPTFDYVRYDNVWDTDLFNTNTVLVRNAIVGVQIGF